MKPIAVRRRICGFPIVIALLAVAATTGVAPVPAGAAISGAPEQARFVPGELLVKFRPGVSTPSKATLLRELDATTVRNLSVPGVKLVHLDGGESVPAAVDAFEDESQVLYAEPNFIYRAQAEPDDPLFPLLWGLRNDGQFVAGAFGTPGADIGAPLAWDTTTGSSSVIVAVADSGVAYDHPDLVPNILPGHDFVDEDSDPRDFNGHGTHVAGTIGAAGDNGAGIAGVNWDVSLLPVRVLDGEGSGTNEQVAEGFEYAAAQGARVVNASLGGPDFSQTILNAIKGAPNTLFVVAAGNEGEDNDLVPDYPCNFAAPNIVCVAATDQDDQLAEFSNYGAASVDLAAPGTSVLSTKAAYAPVFTEGFEAPIDSTWTTEGTNNTWARSEEASSGGDWSLTDSPGADYLDETNSFARTTNPLSLSGQTGCRLEYALALETEFEFDYLAVEASTSSTGPWKELAAWTGSTEGEFFTLDNDLSDFDGEANVFVRFVLESDEIITADGAHIDDVTVHCLTSTYAGDEFQFLDGTSMATPHVAGTAALLLAQQPGLSAAEVKSRLLASVEIKPSLACATLSGGRLDAGLVLDPSVTPPAKPSCSPPPPPSQPAVGATPATEGTTTANKKRSFANRRCASARRSLARARLRFSRAQRTLLRAENSRQRRNAERNLSRATRQLTLAKKKKRRLCRRRQGQA